MQKRSPLTPDDVLRRMLNMPPAPHVQKAKPKKAKKARK